jgi:hypothetical protein
MPGERATQSGYTLVQDNAPVVMGMVKRGDRDHDIAAWFGVDQGQIAEVKDGSKFGVVAAAPADKLPPRGPPGIKGRRLREALERALSRLERDGVSGMGMNALLTAGNQYDSNET